MNQIFVDPQDWNKLKNALDAFHKLITVTYPSVQWSQVAEESSRLSRGEQPTNIIGLQVSNILRDNQIVIGAFKVEDL